jgi:hypothetical protein
VLWTVLNEIGLDNGADLGIAKVLSQNAARVKAAPAGGIERAGNVTAHEAVSSGGLDLRVRDGSGRQERLGVGVNWLFVQSLTVSDLDDFAQVHDGNPVRNVSQGRKVVRDEEKGEPELLLKVYEEVQDLGLDRHIKRGDGLVGDDEVRFHGKGAGDTDALALPARQGPTSPRSSSTRRALSSLFASACTLRGSLIAAPTFIRGLRDA